MSKQTILQVTEQATESRDDALYAAGVALDTVVAWYADEGLSGEEILERCEESIERASDDG